MKRIAQASLWIILICLIALGPVWLGSASNRRKQLIQKKYDSWTGVLRLWKHEGFEYGNGALTGWLNICVSVFEKAHPGAYVQITDVSREQISSFETAGVNPPDMILFGPGELDAPYSLMEMTDALPLRKGLDETGVWDGAMYAAPVAMGGYAMAINSRLLPDSPEDWAILTEETFSDEQIEILNAPADEANTSWSAALLHLFAGNYQEQNAPQRKPVGEGVDLGLEEIIETETIEETEKERRVNHLPSALPGNFRENAEDVYRRFTKGNLTAMPVTQKEIQKLRRLSESGAMTDWRVESMGLPFTDQITFLAVTACHKDDLSARQKLCMQFLQLMLSEEMQKKLTVSGALTVRESFGIYQGVQGMDVMEESFFSEDAAYAPAFGSEWRSYAERLMSDISSGAETYSVCEQLRQMLITP